MGLFDFKSVIFKVILRIDSLGASRKICVMRMEERNDNKSTLVQLKAW